MSVNIQQIKLHLKAGRFRALFLEELGWNGRHESPITVSYQNHDYRFTFLAEKAGFKVYTHIFMAAIPEDRILKQLDRRLDPYAHAHMTIFVDARQEHQVWLWINRELGQPARPRINKIPPQNDGELLARKIEQIAIDLREEEIHPPSLTEIQARVKKALNVEKITKRFYEKFKEQHGIFLKYVKNITDEDDCKWYTSIMLNRLMFIYFIQKQGILDNDRTDRFAGKKDYLRERLVAVRASNGPDNFYRFYRYFLLHLFHDGLNTRESERPPGMDDIIGHVPYLNGGIFDIHHLEEKYLDIQIEDEAFEKLFDLFDEFDWTLDDRAESNGKEINPDVLGYIFEKYINQKQMGAYYTKEDITEYISKNTVIPFLFHKVAQDHPEAFQAGGPVWALLRDNPDDYIYGALAHGLNEPLLPPHIEAGMNDIAQRASWNQPADEPFALPTETWREVVARRQRYEEVRARIADGQLNSINDLITYNLNITQFASDVIACCSEPAMLSAWYAAITRITVLDPTCGSGAFLFAALNILKPLYYACTERMRVLLAESEQTPQTRRTGLDHLAVFKKTLAQVHAHPSQEHFILKAIMVHNLYGVDIMEEATEICKLRLFLKLVAQITRPQELEPLPDIDFNILAGNTLIGFTSLDEIRQLKTPILQQMGDAEETLARIEQRAQEIERAEGSFRYMQTEQTIHADYAGAKHHLLTMLADLRKDLDLYLRVWYR